MLKLQRRFLSVFLVVMILAACGGPAASTDTVEETATVELLSVDVPTAEPQEDQEEPLVDRAEVDIGASGEGSVDTTGQYIADFGFRPDYDGFSFPNYGADIEVVNLTEQDVYLMFGETACAYVDDDGWCTLTPAGQQWMEAINQAMAGGHCEGMAVLSTLFYTQRLNVADYGADTVPELYLEDNEALQREIAYWFTTQATMPAREGIVPQTPSGVVNTLLNAFAAGPEGSETYALGFYKRDMTGGHAVTPYAVEDKGDGIYWIMIYDNNYPGAARAIEVDTNNDTWYYNGSTNPDEPADDYEGDAETFTLELAQIEQRLDFQYCSFCEESDPSVEADRGSSGAVAYNEVHLDGAADLLLTDLEGRSVGFRDGEFVNEIPGARTNANKFGVSVWNIDAEPIYYVPTDIDFTISIDGSQLTEGTTSTVTFIGPGYVLEVSDIWLEPGQVDILDIAPDGSLLSYFTTSSVSPFILLGVETDEADYMFAVQGYELAPDQGINFSIDQEEGWVSLDSIDNTEASTYSLFMVKYDAEGGEQIFGADDVVLNPDDVVYFDYVLWPGNGQPLEMEVDLGGDGEVEEVLIIEDITDELDEEN